VWCLVGVGDPGAGDLYGVGKFTTPSAAIEREEAARGTRRAVAGFDYTFSVPKSVSVLWGVADAGTQALIARAHHDAVQDVLAFMEREVVATRTGSGGRGGAVVQSDVAGVVAAAFDHHDSRAGDPQLHTHVVIANRVQTLRDGKWRTIRLPPDARGGGDAVRVLQRRPGRPSHPHARPGLADPAAGTQPEPGLGDPGGGRGADRRVLVAVA